MLEDALMLASTSNHASGSRDLVAAQNGVNRVASRLGSIGRMFDAWFRCGKTPPSHLDDLAGDLAVEAIVLLVNVVGSARAAEVLVRRLNVMR